MYVYNVLKSYLLKENKIIVLNVNKKIGLYQLMKNNISNILLKIWNTSMNLEMMNQLYKNYKN